ncbi:MAG: fimbrial protein pilin [Candidatus Wolfebacteria bacterium GW2011_GWE1_48_7]|uniref:Fimbrial protein pilin n=2 Tax=Candidatus Wolfeibacteriota TaxID=1752735 RepID=A0A0G1U8L4_9BACT|nr:MAG: hypothetical protein UX70_C0001G0477 [Candidatus Wolfebacteria bacterium GW2011_GWB1_47_1]KKU37163.1 MAG: fimbrial protein pilin [Candidatus Wolfebacteria bacterium GW2011_GWC2_46_275]KKU42677.1 MAG: fimbrial protein pilin [Candidatus Wolfebacteria bacterium GW2011_GWB2_46_69]KKU54588.1 MAG: fimbrial protein pilin [Candidatus Wolfebacteria bacterium GW2011_GWC1_47_103]KKU59972.1 MAG: fimbrial protein pilin [Candidatus Wolfebacteria bacterium GW2011_GWE2_47_12]KKU66380.1 MAG: fimbrial p
MKTLHYKKGFTLVEMLIVIAIIAILASVALVSVGGVRQSARDTKRVSDISKLQQQLEVYYSQNGAYPADLATFSAFAGSEANFTDPLNDPYAYAAYDNDQKYLLGINMEGGTSAENEPNEVDALPTGLAAFSISCTEANLGYCVGN